jgi:hypothetical protein
MNVQTHWAIGLFTAAEELGFLVESMDNHGVVLRPMRGPDVRIEIGDTPLLSGDRLRELLVPRLPEPKPCVHLWVTRPGRVICQRCEIER